MPETGRLGPKADDALNGARPENGIAPGDLPSPATGLLPEHEVRFGVVVVRTVGAVDDEVAAQELHELGSAHNAPRAPGLSDPADLGRGVLEVDLAHPQADDLRRPHAGQAEPQHELVTHPDGPV